MSKTMPHHRIFDPYRHCGGWCWHSSSSCCFSAAFSCRRLELIGAEHIEINMNETYQDPGAQSTYRFMDNRAHIIVENQVDTQKLGTYQVIYRLDNADKKVIRQVTVSDTKAPDLRLKGEEEMTLFIGEDIYGSRLSGV